MNGTSANRVEAGRLFRPATLAEAVVAYPAYAVGLRFGGVSVSKNFGPDGPRLVSYVDSFSGASIIVHLSDHERIAAAAARIPVICLPGLPRLEAASAMIAVEFADRR